MFGIKNPFTVTTGLKLNHRSIKLLQLSRVKTHIQLEQFAEISLLFSLDLFKHDPNLETVASKKNEKPMSDILREINQRAKPPLENVVIALPDTAVIKQVLSVESLDDSMAIEAQILFAAERHMACPIEEIYFDYQPLNTDAKDKNKILWIATRKEVVMQSIQTISKSGMRVSVVDVESLALVRAYQYTAETDSQKDVVALFNIDTQFITLIIFFNQKPIFTHSESLAEENLNIDLKKTLLTLCHRAMQTFFANQTQIVVEQAALSGDYALLPEFIEEFSEFLSIPAELVNPFSKIASAKELDIHALNAVAPRFFQVFGLALHNLERKF